MTQNSVKNQIFCQNCRAANSLRETECVKCGTRLMLVVFPDSMRFETEAAPSYYEDHLLERVSSLETRLSQVFTILERTYDHLERTYAIIEKDREKLQNFLEKLSRTDPQMAVELGSQILGKNVAEIERSNAKNREELILREMLAAHENPNQEIFANLVREGLSLLAQKDEKGAFQMLERAAQLSPQNIPLHLFNAVSCFRADKFAAAAKYLEKINAAESADSKIALLTAALMIDEGENSKAERLLGGIEETARNADALKFLSAFTAAAEGNWEISAKLFAEIYEIGASAEIAYLTGCAFFQSNEFQEALKYLEKAVLSDVNFSDAWLMSAVVYRRQNSPELEKMSLEKAAAGRLGGSQSARFLQKNKIPELTFALPFEHLRGKKCRVLSGGALRVVEFYKRIVLNVVEG